MSDFLGAAGIVVMSAIAPVARVKLQKVLHHLVLLGSSKVALGARQRQILPGAPTGLFMRQKANHPIHVSSPKQSLRGVFLAFKSSDPIFSSKFNFGNIYTVPELNK